MTYARIAGTGGYLPERVLTNRDLEQLVQTNDRWIQERTGIQERRIAADDQTCRDLAMIAASRAMDAAGVQAADIDLVIVATCTPDRVFPSTACLVQSGLGVPPGAIAFDLAAACSGFVYGLDVANRFLQTGGARRALVIGSETMSRIIDC